MKRPMHFLTVMTFLFASVVIAQLGSQIILTHAFADDAKIPAEQAEKILKLQLEKARMQTQLSQIQSQCQALTMNKMTYQQTVDIIQHDDGETENIKREILAAEKKDPAKFDVDTENLMIVAKPAPPVALPAGTPKN